MYSLKGCKGSNIQGSAQLVDGGPDIQGSVQFGRELMFPSWKIKKRKKFVREAYLDFFYLHPDSQTPINPAYLSPNTHVQFIFI